jgi:hypothetical protein
LPLQPTVGFSLLSDSPPIRPFLTQLSPPLFLSTGYLLQHLQSICSLVFL